MSVAPTNGGNGWVGRWVDADLPLAPDLSRELLAADEVERLLSALAIVLFASQIPRRLGGDATAVELAEDKRRCRRVAWALRQALLQWTKKIELPEGAPPPEIRTAGASLIWRDMEERHLGTLTERTRRIATWSVLNGEKKWGAAMVTRLENERRWVTHSLR